MHRHSLRGRPLIFDTWGIDAKAWETVYRGDCRASESRSHADKGKNRGHQGHGNTPPAYFYIK